MYIYSIIKNKIVFLLPPVHSNQGSSQPRSFVLAHLNRRLLKLSSGAAKMKPVALEGGCFSVSCASAFEVSTESCWGQGTSHPSSWACIHRSQLPRSLAWPHFLLWHKQISQIVHLVGNKHALCSLACITAECGEPRRRRCFPWPQKCFSAAIFLSSVVDRNCNIQELSKALHPQQLPTALQRGT